MSSISYNRKVYLEDANTSKSAAKITCSDECGISYEGERIFGSTFVEIGRKIDKIQLNKGKLTVKQYTDQLQILIDELNAFIKHLKTTEKIEIPSYRTKPSKDGSCMGCVGLNNKALCQHLFEKNETCLFDDVVWVEDK